MRRSLSAWFSAALGIALGLSSALAAAQTAMPSADQLEMLRNLTPEQREAILGQLSGGGGSGASAAGGNGRGDAAGGKRDRTGERTDREGEALLAGFPPETPVLKPEDSVLLSVDFRKARMVVPPGSPPGTAPVEEVDSDPLTPLEREKLQTLIELLRSRNPYTLDRNGALQLPGFPAIALAGLTAEEATQRLAAEQAFLRLEVSLRRLPLAPSGVAGLKPFGYDLFEQDPATFEPVTDAPVPADYVVGPGDQLSVQLYGNQNRSLRLTVGRDGRINFPELGPIQVGGQRFEAVRASLESRVQSQMIGVRASVSMGETRSIRVFVLGEARRPGSYTISGLGTMTTALFASGGVKDIGSLRDIQLKRQGAIVRRMDLYDLLLRGDTSNDAKLQAGDVIFIPPVGATVSVDGEVRRPAIYEVRGNQSVADVLQLSGGLTPEADAQRITLSRVDEQQRRLVLDVNAATPEGRAQMLRNGDVIRVSRVRPQVDSGVLLQGHVHRPGLVAWRDGLRVSDVVPSVDDLKPNADLGYLLIRREVPPDRRVVALSADLSRALRDRGGDADLRLWPRDQITVFDLESGREREIQRLMDDIRLQARLDRPTQIVRVGGRVRVAGEYPLEPNMTVSDLIRAGGNLTDAAYGGTAELTRYEVVGGEARRTELITIDLGKVLMGDTTADVPLKPFDFLNIKEIPEWAEQEQVTLLGEVKFPGTYPIKRGETLASVLQRAGGFSELAFPEGSVFTRRDLKEREQQQLDQLAARLQNDLATMALQAAAANQSGAAQAASVGQSLLSQLKSSKAVGRLVIDVEKAVAGAPGSAGDIVLQDGDLLMIPKKSQEVTVIGEIQNATSHFYRKGLSRDDYISLSGGTTRKADDDRIYIVRADGSVVSAERGRWFSRNGQASVKPGDTIVVPMDTERLPTLPLWQAVTGILYNLAIAAAAINSF
jgi:protein involved in polysaccharide export with SLBB domain